MQVRVSIRTCMPNLGAVRRERFLTIYNPLNPPGVGWVKLKKNYGESIYPHSGADLSAPQQIAVGEPTGRLSGFGEQTCQLPRKLPLGCRQVGYLALGSRPVGSPANCRWGADRSVPKKIAVGGPT